MLKNITFSKYLKDITWSKGAPVLRRYSRAALFPRNCLPEGATQPFALPRQVQPLALVIGSSDFDVDVVNDGSVLNDEDGEERRLAESCEGSIIPDMKVDWLGSELEVEPSSMSSKEKLVRLEPEKLELEKLEVASEELFTSVE